MKRCFKYERMWRVGVTAYHLTVLSRLNDRITGQQTKNLPQSSHMPHHVPWSLTSRAPSLVNKTFLQTSTTDANLPPCHADLWWDHRLRTVAVDDWLISWKGMTDAILLLGTSWTKDPLRNTVYSLSLSRWILLRKTYQSPLCLPPRKANIRIFSPYLRSFSIGLQSWRWRNWNAFGFAGRWKRKMASMSGNLRPSHLVPGSWILREQVETFMLPPSAYSTLS